jgi:hypothetical protein
VLGDIQTSGDTVIQASDDDVQFDISTPQVIGDLGLDTSASGSFFDCSASAEIVVSGSIRAGGSVKLAAYTSQTKSLLDLSVGAINDGENLLADLNFLNVKVATPISRFPARSSRGVLFPPTQRVRSNFR